MRHQKRTYKTIILLTATLSLVLAPLAMAKSRGRPNILVIMVDDLGFSDIGCYGGEIDTPHLDRLANNGLRFSQFYNTAKCHSSRVSLLTGKYCYQAGNTKLTKAVTSAEVLSKAGYFTMMTGKWHLSKEPTDFGFDRYFGHLSGATNYYLGDNTFRLNGEPWPVPKEGFYSTVADVDFAIDFLGQARKTQKPWYLYIAFNAPHAPLQPLKEDYLKYKGRYDKGWDKIRQARLKKQAKLGLLGKKTTPSPRPEHVRSWDKLSQKWRDAESLRMSAIAGIIDRVDQEIGRLVANLKEAGELDNTMILFISDNGACPYDRRKIDINDQPYDPKVIWGDSTGWSWMRNSPFRYYKQNQFEGGISTPAIVHWPAGLKTKPGEIVHTPAHIIDVLPTMVELCDAKVPATWPDRELNEISGVSLAPVFAGKSLDRSKPIHFLFSTDRALRDGDWKIVSFKSAPWELYNIKDDRTETNDLAQKHPERVANMVNTWHQMATEVLEAPKRNQLPVATEVTKHTNVEWTDFDRDPASRPKRRKK